MEFLGGVLVGVVGLVLGVFLSDVMMVPGNEATWNKPYEITMETVTPADLKKCQRDDNCMDIYSFAENPSPKAKP